jgi:CheY-like chemotaxis protein
MLLMRRHALPEDGPKLMKREKKVFLVVEDFEDSRFMMRRLLEMAGYEVLEASDGEQAVKIAVDARPSLILMDLSLPNLMGCRQPERFARSESCARCRLSLFQHMIRLKLRPKRAGRRLQRICYEADRL